MPDERPGSFEAGQSNGAERGGEDGRRRGWFWHWNTIITQYAPLIGLKGVGLLNSYTVWTDRREESPHHGYAFPSQQAESDFYGEDRAELITINKILVALNLIEIRKEMVRKIDGQGRRWRVPHNLYRVKDHPDGYLLTVEDVLRVIDLARRDRAVYRYVRRVFSPRFSPIDRDNVWHQLLPTLRQHPAWQELAERTAQEEAKASARTKAGHRSRARSDNGGPTDGSLEMRQQLDNSEDSRARAGGGQPVRSGHERTVVEAGNDGLSMAVGDTNNGQQTGVDETNAASSSNNQTFAAEANQGREGAVAGSNTTYDQDTDTTTTTTTAGSWVDHPPASASGAGPVPSPADAVVAYFEAANSRQATLLERELLGELQAEFAAPARAIGSSGEGWLIAAIREAVGSGSRFVAPKRLREILNRWSSQGDPVRPGGALGTSAALSNAALPLPGEQDAVSLWQSVRQRLAMSLEPDTLARLFDGSRISSYRDGAVTVAVASAESAERLAGEYYDPVARLLAEAIGRPVRIEFNALGAAVDPPVDSSPPSRAMSGKPSLVPPQSPSLPRVVLPGGLTNRQVWSAAQEELARRLSRASWESWIRPATLLGIDDDALLIGAPNAFACQRLSGRLLPELEAVLSEILNQPVRVRVVLASDWLRQQPSSGADPNE